MGMYADHDGSKLRDVVIDDRSITFVSISVVTPWSSVRMDLWE
jgi:hypothetical protein